MAKIKLSDDYEINVDQMLDIKEHKGDFKVIKASFYNLKGTKVNRNVLSNETEGECRQIFSMKDGTFILEIDDCINVEYFYSKDINDLL